MKPPLTQIPCLSIITGTSPGKRAKVGLHPNFAQNLKCRLKRFKERKEEYVCGNGMDIAGLC